MEGPGAGKLPNRRARDLPLPVPLAASRGLVDGSSESLSRGFDVAKAFRPIGARDHPRFWAPKRRLGLDSGKERESVMKCRTAIFALAVLAGFYISPSLAQAPADTSAVPAAADSSSIPADSAAAPQEARAAAVKYEKAKIVVDGKAEANGMIQLLFAPEGGKSMLLVVDVIKGRKKNEIAKAIETKLAIAAGEQYKIKVSGGEVGIERAKKENPTFTLTVEKLETAGVSVLVKKG